MGGDNVEVLCTHMQAAHESRPRDGAEAVVANASTLCPREVRTVEEADWTV